MFWLILLPVVIVVGYLIERHNRVKYWDVEVEDEWLKNKN